MASYNFAVENLKIDDKLSISMLYELAQQKRLLHLTSCPEEIFSQDLFFHIIKNNDVVMLHWIVESLNDNEEFWKGFTIQISTLILLRRYNFNTVYEFLRINKYDKRCRDSVKPFLAPDYYCRKEINVNVCEYEKICMNFQNIFPKLVEINDIYEYEHSKTMVFILSRFHDHGVTILEMCGYPLTYILHIFSFLNSLFLKRMKKKS